MKTISNQHAWAELASAQDGVTRTSDNLNRFLTRLNEDESAEGSMLGDQITEVRNQLEDAKRRLRMLANYYIN